MVRPKNTASTTISIRLAPTTHSVWPLTFTRPSSKLASEKAGVREPSAPKNSRPSPTNAQCTATDTISSTSTLASARGWKASR
jgi:hypothetical protein